MTITTVAVALTLAGALAGDELNPKPSASWRYVIPVAGDPFEHAPFRALVLSREKPEDLIEKIAYRGEPARRRYARIRFGSPSSTRVTVVIDTTAAGDRRRWIALIVVCLAMLMNALDSSIVNVALPSIQHDLGFSQSSLTWVIDAYLITFGSFLLMAGRLGDLIGRKLVFLSGIVLFTVSSAVCGLATSQAMLIGGRFLGEFVPAGLPWVHLDIAGPAFNPGAARDYTPKGGTGAGVRTLIAAVERLAAG